MASRDFAQREAAQKQLDQLPASQYADIQALAGTQTDEEVKARLQARATQMLRDYVGQRMTAPLRPAAHLTGRILNDSGKPIAGARISAVAPAWGNEMTYAARQAALTAPDGTVAVTGTDVVEVDDAGRLLRIVGFFGDPTPA